MRLLLLIGLLFFIAPAVQADPPYYAEHTIAAGDSVASISFPANFQKIRFSCSTADVKVRLTKVFSVTVGLAAPYSEHYPQLGGLERYGLFESSVELWNEFTGLDCNYYVLVNTGASSADVRVQAQ